MIDITSAYMLLVRTSHMAASTFKDTEKRIPPVFP